jgi:hypothetical protein
VYLVGEGGGFFPNRVAAWKRARGIDPVANAYYLFDPVRLLQREDVADLMEVLATLAEAPGLIVIDTLARAFVGGDENSQRDMGLFLAACDDLVRTTGATILVLHHLARAGNLRGSTALAGHLDTEIRADREGDVQVLRCVKQKDGAEFASLSFQRRVIDLGIDPASGEALTSVVLDASASPAEPTRRGRPTGPDTVERVRAVLVATFGDQGATATDWQRACRAVGVRDNGFWQARTELVASGRVVAPTQPRGGRYRPAEEG